MREASYSQSESNHDEAKRVRECAETFMPVYFLACQSIELSLKAYLRATGSGEIDLKKVGHNLQKCVESARKAGINDRVTLSDVDMTLIQLANPHYLYKGFQYSVTGYKTLPRVDLLIELAKRLWESLRSFCVERREYHFRQAHSDCLSTDWVKSNCDVSKG